MTSRCRLTGFKPPDDILDTDHRRVAWRQLDPRFALGLAEVPGHCAPTRDGDGRCVIRQVRGQQPSQMGFVEHDDPVEKLAAEGPYHPFRVRILPWRARGDHHFFDPHVGHPLTERITIDAVSISQQKARRSVKGKGFDNLLCRPLGGWMRRNVEMDDLTLLVTQDEKAIEHPKSQGRHGKEVDGGDIRDMIARNVRQVCDGGLRVLGMYLTTVVCDTV